MDIKAGATTLAVRRHAANAVGSSEKSFAALFGFAPQARAKRPLRRGDPYSMQSTSSRRNTRSLSMDDENGRCEERAVTGDSDEGARNGFGSLGA